jgi:hypothetical protein
MAAFAAIPVVKYCPLSQPVSAFKVPQSTRRGNANAYNIQQSGLAAKSNATTAPKRIKNPMQKTKRNT